MSVSSSDSLPIVVLQGEFAVVDHNKCQARLKSPVPSTCTVLTLFNQERQIAVMAHIDDYTGVQGVFNKIELLLRNLHQTSLTEISFKAKVMGGTEDSFSKSQQQAVIVALDDVGILWEMVELGSERPQIEMNTATGELHFRSDINRALEYLQLREFGDFNTLIDLKYGLAKGEDIPFFEPKEAARIELQNPFLDQVKNVSVSLPGSIKSTNWVDCARALETMGSLEVQICPERQEIVSQEIVSSKVSSLVLGRFNQFPALKRSLETRNFALMLRQCAAEKRVYDLFAFLFENANSLLIPLTAKGQTSGTVWNIADSKGNQRALDCMSQRRKS